MANNDNPTSQQGTSGFDGKDTKTTNRGKKANDFQMPFLVEFSYTFSAIFLVVVFVMMAAIALFTGTTVIDFIMRTTVAMLLLGGLFMMVSRQVSSGVMTARLSELEEILQQTSITGSDPPAKGDQAMNEGIENQGTSPR